MVGGRQRCFDCVWAGLVILFKEPLVILEDVIGFGFVFEQVFVDLGRGAQIAEEVI